jgi:methionyl-tRNA formyltransferase
MYRHAPHPLLGLQARSGVQVRGFAGWPGTLASVRVVESGKPDAPLQLKILRTRLAAGRSAEASPTRQSDKDVGAGEVMVGNDALAFPCGDGGVLEALEVQVPGKRPAAARAFKNGFAGKRMYIDAAAV